jgi:hypothetical protein
MELLRLLPYQNVEVEFTIPSGYVSNETFTATITDMADLSFTTQTVTDNTAYVWTINLPGLYDSDYRVEIRDASGDIIHDDTYQVRRPYVDPNTLAETATDIASKTANEELARAIIDSVIPQGFYYKKVSFETVGLGADYLPLWLDAKKILKVYENNVLVYDASSPADYERNFEITKDKTAITQIWTGALNRAEGASLILPAGNTDYLDLNIGYFGAFPKSFDYKVVVESGHTAVPSDIARAIKMLINDIECGQLDYYKRYVTAYNTDQYKLQFDDKRVFEGTGNILVDKILSKYAKSITRLGVL